MKIGIIILGLAICALGYACSDNNSAIEDHTYTKPVTEETPGADAPFEEKGKGHVAFQQKCASCHGSDGTAGIGNAANLQTSKMDRVLVSKIIADGKGAMPSFKEQFSKEAITELSNYVFTLRR